MEKRLSFISRQSGTRGAVFVWETTDEIVSLLEVHDIVLAVTRNTTLDWWHMTL